MGVSWIHCWERRFGMDGEILEGIPMGISSPQERKDAVVSQLVGFFGNEAQTPVGYLEKNWLDDRWIRNYLV